MSPGKKIGYLLLGIIALVAVALYPIIRNYRTDPLNMEEIRKNAQASMESLMAQTNREDKLRAGIEQSIHEKKFDTAYKLMNALSSPWKNNDLLVYQGMIWTEKENYPEAIKEYTEAINYIDVPRTRDLRAQLYIKMNQLELALADYKIAYHDNVFFAQHVAYTFVLMKKKDSALKYYNEYLATHPADTAVQRMARVLSGQK